ncbi:MAG: hypothetical protein HQL06_08705 [Nitrospirae bacterium]|nr:hypothetical protein [Nitrospirota bacterium]
MLDTQEAMVFLDLDDTIFQTLRKNPEGRYPATGTSFMTEAQRLFLDIFLNSEQILVVPITARDTAQYNRTFLSQHPRIKVSVLYYSGLITTDGLHNKQWHKHTQSLYQDLTPSIQAMYERTLRLLNSFVIPAQTGIFKLYNVDNYYVTIKHNNTSVGDYMQSNERLVSELQGIVEYGYNIYHNDNNISLVPNFLNKKNAVNYLIEQYRPKLTIGVGDSLSDIGFITQCNYGIFPSNSQIGSLVRRKEESNAGR